MFHFIHKWRYFGYLGLDAAGNVFRECVICNKSQWWMPITKQWSTLEHRNFTEGIE
jgi:hypothetical protein